MYQWLIVCMHCSNAHSYSSCCDSLCVIIAVKTITIIVWKTIIKYTVFLCFFRQLIYTCFCCCNFSCFVSESVNQKWLAQKQFRLNFIAVSFQEFFFVFKSIDVWMTMLMNHYSVHLILIASALNTYLVSGIAFIWPVNLNAFFSYLNPMLVMILAWWLLFKVFYGLSLARARCYSTCWSNAYSFIGILEVISEKRDHWVWSNLIKKGARLKTELIKTQSKWLKNEHRLFQEYINQWSEILIHQFRYAFKKLQRAALLPHSKNKNSDSKFRTIAYFSKWRVPVI